VAYARRIHSINESTNSFRVLEKVEKVRMRIENPLELLVFFTRRQVGENQRLWGRLIKPLREGRYAAVVLFAKAIILGKL
jgi:hypothetical protein